jgi:chaperonin GroES
MSEVKLKPFGDIVVLEPIEPDEKTAGGIILPDTAKEQRLCGRVVAAGPGKLREDGGRDPMDVEIGDVVYYQKYSGDPYQEDGKEYRMMHQTALFGKF